MKLKFIILPALAFFVSVIGISSAHAQIDRIAKADIPFDFIAGGQQLPAGTYNIGIDVTNDIVSISDDSGRHQVLLLGNSAGAVSGNPDLVFDHSGDNYSLREIESDIISLDFPKAKAGKTGTQSAQIHVKLNHA
jgi:hypothetical protein